MKRRLQDFVDTYTTGLTADDFQRLFTRDAPDAYKFFTRGLDAGALKDLPYHQRFIAQARAAFMAFTMKLSPARRMLYAISLVLAFIGLIDLFEASASCASRLCLSASALASPRCYSVRARIRCCSASC